jgi:hypothetical protein
MNAMLRERILPVGMGHTTNCFLQIEGTDKAEPYVLTPGSDEPKCVSVSKWSYKTFFMLYFFCFRVWVVLAVHFQEKNLILILL